MNKRRLLKLADLLEADARRKQGIKFDLRTVVETGAPKNAKTVPMSCGTTACAMGLAAISGEFKRQGLSYKVDNENFDADKQLFIDTTMRGRVVDYDAAAMELFEISDLEADFLFTPSSYDSHSQMVGAEGERYVAQRIRDFVAGKAAPPPRFR